MERFHVIEDGACILRMPKGVFRQAKVFRRGEDVFAAYGAGFVKLSVRGGTSNPNVSWLDVEAEGVATNDGAKPVFR